MIDLEDFFNTDDPAEETKEEKPKKTHRRTEACIQRSDKHLYRRAFSESQLMDAVGVDFKDGETYHCITGGDVDALSFLKVVIRQQPLKHCLFSTWCMAAEDILQFREWVESKQILKLDAYVGEIFPGSYKVEWKMLNDMYDELKCGNIAVFKNHSKIFEGYGDKFSFGIATSANINTNPRTENGTITINKDIYKFYNDYFSGIQSFENS